MNPQRALVTGATGFVGSHVVERLLADGWQVHVVARRESAVDRLSPAIERIKVHRTDASIDSMRSIVREAKPDVVFHLASLFLSDHRSEDVPRLFESNVSFGASLLEAMSREGVQRLVNTGTSWQHYEGRDYSPVNLYAATKQAFESILQFYVEAHGLNAVTLMLFDTYGPGDPRSKFLNLLLHAARTGTQLAASPGEQSIDLVHVEDVARAYARAGELLQSGSCNGHESFAVSSGASITLRALVTELERSLGISVPVAWGGRAYRQREAMKPWQGGRPLPGWQAKIPLSEGLKGLR